MTRREFLQALGWTTAGAVVFGPTLCEARGGVTAEQVETLPLLVGDVLTIEGCYCLNPVTHLPTAQLQLFVITAVDGGGVRLYPKPRTWSTDWVPAEKTRPIWARRTDADQERGGLEQAQERTAGHEAVG